MNDQLSPDAHARLEQYLDAVEDVLRKQGQGREERISVVDELTGQIYDTLDRVKLTGQTINLNQMTDVLGHLDPPEAYAHKEDDLKPIPAMPPVQGKTTAPKHLTRWAIPGLIALGLFVFSTLLFMFMAFYLMTSYSNDIHFGSYEFWAMLLTLLKETLANPFRSDTSSTVRVYIMYFQPDRSSSMAYQMLIPLVLSLPGLFAPLVTTICGIITLVKVKQSPHLHTGWRLGVRMTLIFPLLLTHSLFTSVMRTLVNLIYNILIFNPTRPMREQFAFQNPFDTANLLDLFTVFVCMIFTVVLAIIAVKILNQFKPKQL